MHPPKAFDQNADARSLFTEVPMPMLVKTVQQGLLASAAAAALVAVFAPSFSVAAKPDAPASPATQSTSAGLDEAVRKQIADAIEDLGSTDFTTRSKAARTLWTIGDVAKPALKEAGESDNPEVARRARGVLYGLAFGVRPDTPQAVLDQLDLYRQGDPDQRRSIASSLAEQGVHGARVLLKLTEDEPDPTVRQVLINVLGTVGRTVFARLIAEDDFTSAEKLVSTLAPHADYAARDLAAFALLHGDIDRSIAGVAKEDAKNPPPLQKLRLACLYRAKGDYAKAADAAMEANDLLLHGSLMADAGKYAELATEMERRGIADSSVEEVGFITAFYRLAGKKADADRWAAKLVAYANQNPSDHWNAVEALLLSERPEQAIDVLISKHNYFAAADFLAARLDFTRMEEVVKKARADGTGDLPKILSRYAQLQHFTGKSAAAAETLQSVAKGEQGQIDFETWIEIVGSAPAAGIEREKIESWIAQGLVTARPQDDLGRLLDRGGFADSARAAAWWRILRDHRAGNTPDEALAIVRRLDRKQTTGDELAKLLDKTRELAATLPLNEQQSRLNVIVQTLADLGKLDEAIKQAESIPEQSRSQEQHIRLGELYGRTKKWEQALDAFTRAYDLNPSAGSPLALRAWALKNLGKADEAAKAIERAHLLPLADETKRHALADVFARHDMKEEALKERQLTAKLGDPASWEVCDSTRRLADEVAAKDPLEAARLWDRAFLANLTTRTMFVDSSANLGIPVLIRRTKAVGKVRAGDIAGAIEDARICFELMPGDADAQIAIIRALDKAGKKPEADAIYKRAFDYVDAIRATYPDSAPANNLVAWLSGCVKRDLDNALKCAQKGVELEPKSTAILDTLSEVYYARGEYDDALAINKRCQEMEPFIPHHKENFERFQRAKEGKPELTE